MTIEETKEHLRGVQVLLMKIGAESPMPKRALAHISEAMFQIGQATRECAKPAKRAKKEGK